MDCKPLTQGRVYNFSAGPSTLPEEVVFNVQKQLHNYEGVGFGVMEMSHRSKEYMQIAKEATDDLRELLKVPDNYHILFMHGGGCGQMAAIPFNMNAVGDDAKVDYVESGNWSKRAIGEVKKFCKVNVCASGKAESGLYTHAPAASEWKLQEDSKYVYYCDNETIAGVEYLTTPEVPEGKILISDMSSNILSKPIDISKYGMIYAGAQKNLGPAGITVVIVRDDLLGKKHPYTPEIMDWAIVAKAKSMKNTPSTFPWYVCGQNLKWVKAQGGVEEMARRHDAMASKLYKFLDENVHYKAFVEPNSRSRINAPFTFGKANAELEPVFLKEAAARGLANLKGHRDLGGFRASMYNGLPVEAVDALIAFMTEFAEAHADEI